MEKNLAKYRILEFKSGFTIQEKVFEKKYYGLWPFSKFVIVSKWVNYYGCKVPQRIAPFPVIYDTIEEAEKVISEIGKYPIYHYLEK